MRLWTEVRWLSTSFNAMWRKQKWYPQNSWFRRHGWCQALSMALWRVHDRSKTVSCYAVHMGFFKTREPQHSVSFWKSCYPCVTGIVLVQLVYCIVMYTLFRGKPGLCVIQDHLGLVSPVLKRLRVPNVFWLNPLISLGSITKPTDSSTKICLLVQRC